MQSSWIYDIADLFLLTETSAALLTWDGEILQAKSRLGFETVGFRTIAENSLKYIKAKPGDVVLNNDPYTGGSFLYRYNFLMPLTMPNASSPGLVLCIRREFSASLSFCDKLDEEGLRIPPTPVFQNNQLVTPIIEAMSLHPLCPQGFSAWLEETIEELKVYFQKWQRLEKNLKVQFTSTQIKNFLTFSHRFASEKVSEKAQGESRSEVRLDSGELLKLHLEIHNGMVKADFGGSSAGFKIHLPDSAAFGACYDALAEFYGLNDFKNSGTFSVLQLTKPTGCFLSSRYPASTQRGLSSGVAAVKLAMSMALHQIVKTKQALNTESELHLEMAFKEGQRWLSHWSPKPGCETLSLEQIETLYPVSFIKIEKDPEHSQLQVEFRILAPCQLRWHSDFTLHALRLPKPWQKNPMCRLETFGENEEWLVLPSQGSTDLPPQTLLRLSLWGTFDS